MIEWLEDWYLSYCDGDWEHGYGIKIETIDNPGWAVDINLIDTKMEDIKFVPIKIERTENDWIHCSVKDCVFIGRGGPKNLKELLNIFKEWVIENQEKK